MASNNQQANTTDGSLWPMAKRVLAAVAALESEQDREKLQARVARERDEDVATHTEIASSTMAVRLTWVALIAGALAFAAFWLLG